MLRLQLYCSCMSLSALIYGAMDSRSHAMILFATANINCRPSLHGVDGNLIRDYGSSEPEQYDAAGSSRHESVRSRFNLRWIEVLVTVFYPRKWPSQLTSGQGCTDKFLLEPRPIFLGWNGIDMASPFCD